MCEAEDISIGQKRDERAVYARFGGTTYKLGSDLDSVRNALETLGATLVNNLGDIDGEFQNLEPIVYEAIKVSMRKD
jgi:hypothetical protein